MNKLIIIGNLTRDPETRTTQDGKTVCSFGVAVNRRVKAGQEAAADFFNVSAWGAMGENCQKYLTKGRKAAVCGPVTARTYTAGDGTMRASLNVLADSVEFLTPKGEAQASPSPAPAAADGYEDVTGDGDLPF